MENILLIEDDKNLRDVIKIFLNKEGYYVTEASDGLKGLNLFNTNNFSLILLDIMLPCIDGWDLCEIIRQKSDIPIIMLTARNKEYDKLRGFNLGIDDYITKPFSLKILSARINAVLKRFNKKTNNSNNINWGSLTINTISRTAKIDDKEIKLTLKEYELLKLLVSNPNQIFTRQQLLDMIWETHDINDFRTVDTHIKQLRKKLGSKRNYIHTVWGVGYKLEEI